MVTCLSTLTRLETLCFGFISPLSRPDQPSQLLPPFEHVVIPSLRQLEFEGVCEYLEDLVARIDTPVLRQFRIRFFNQLIFGVTQLHQFIGRTETLTAPDHADIFFSEDNVEAILSTQTGSILLGVSCHGTDWQLSFLSQVCGRSLPAISNIERLDIREKKMRYSPLGDDVENAQWLELLLPFMAVTELYLSEELALRCVPALQQLVGEVGTGALPTLQNLFLEEFRLSDSVQEVIGQFVAARELSGNSVAIHHKTPRQELRPNDFPMSSRSLSVFGSVMANMRLPDTMLSSLAQLFV